MKTYERIRQRIREKGMKYKDIAELGGYQKSTFSMMMNGKRRLYDEDIIKLCKILGAQPNDFIVLEDSEVN